MSSLTVHVIKRARAGLKYAQICTELNAARIPTPTGSRWWKSHVDQLLRTRKVQELADDQEASRPVRPMRTEQGTAKEVHPASGDTCPELPVQLGRAANVEHRAAHASSRLREVSCRGVQTARTRRYHPSASWPR